MALLWEPFSTVGPHSNGLGAAAQEQPASVLAGCSGCLALLVQSPHAEVRTQARGPSCLSQDGQSARGVSTCRLSHSARHPHAAPWVQAQSCQLPRSQTEGKSQRRTVRKPQSLTHNPLPALPCTQSPLPSPGPKHGTIETQASEAWAARGIGTRSQNLVLT